MSSGTSLHVSSKMVCPHCATRTCAALLALTGAHCPALAQSPQVPGDAGTVWHCWYNDDTTFRCRLTRAPPDPGGDESERTESAPRRSLYPQRGPLPPIVGTILERPARLRGRTITIPLFTPPRDAGFAAQLLQSVMCGSRPACRALVFPSSAAALAAYEEDPARE